MSRKYFFFIINNITIDIIGSGISGLASAYFASKSIKNCTIRIWEKDATAGGLAGSFDFNGISIEKFYHHIYQTDYAMIELLKELGMENMLIWKPAITGYYYQQKNYRLSSPLDLFRYSPLSLPDRIKMGLCVLKTKNVKNWKELDTISARDYILKSAGEDPYKKIWEPLLKGKFGDYAEKISAAWLWAKFRDRGSSRNLLGNEYLGYIKGGFSTLFNKLVQSIESSGHTIYFNTPITAIEVPDGKKVTGIIANGKKFKSDFVICASQLPQFQSLLPEGLTFYKKSISRINFLGNICLILFLKKSLSKFYWNNIADVSAPFVGIIEQTNWINSNEYNNLSVVYISAYVSPLDSRFKMKSDELLEYYFPFIKKIFPNFERKYIEAVTSWNASFAQPLVTMGYSDLIPEIQTPVENMMLCTMAQIYPSDRQVSNGIEMAKRTVEKVEGLIS